MSNTIADGIKPRVMKDHEAIGTGLVAVIVLGVALLGDMMYLQLMHGVFPTGMLFLFCVVVRYPASYRCSTCSLANTCSFTQGVRWSLRGGW